MPDLCGAPDGGAGYVCKEHKAPGKERCYFHDRVEHHQRAIEEQRQRHMDARVGGLRRRRTLTFEEHTEREGADVMQPCGRCSGMAIQHYRGYCIEFEPHHPSGQQWQWTSENYDGPGDPRHGTADTRAEALASVDEQADEEGEE